MNKTFVNGHALIIGVGADLQGTIDDANGLARVLKDPDRCAYPEDQVQVLTGEVATRKLIQRAFWRLKDRTTEDSTVIVYFSGHGGLIVGQKPAYYLLPYGYELTQDRYAETCLSGEDFTDLLWSIPARKLLVLLDCCHAGGIIQPKAGGLPLYKSPLPVEALRRMDAGSGKVIIASSTEGEFSYTAQPYSFFTQALLEALTGQGASRQDGFVRATDLALHAREVVPPRTQGRQHPMMDLEGADNFVLAYYAGGNPKATPFDFGPVPEKSKERPRNELNVEVEDEITGREIEFVNDDQGEAIGSLETSDNRMNVKTRRVSADKASFINRRRGRL